MECAYKYVIPNTLNEGLKILSQSDKKIKILAGGTDLLVRIRDKKENPDIVMDISEIGLNYIREGDKKIIIGAMTPLSSIIYNSRFKKPYSLLIEAAKEVGGVQTRNMGTIGGNVCTGLPNADMIGPLLSLKANLNIVSFKDDKLIPLDQFYISPRKYNLQDDQIVKEIIIDEHLNKDNGLWGSAFIKFGKRKAMRLSILNTSIVVNINPESYKINEIRIAMGAAAPIPIRLYKVEEFITGKIFNENLIKDAIDVVTETINPRSSFRASREYRIELAKTLFKRSFQRAVERALKGDVE